MAQRNITIILLLILSISAIRGNTTKCGVEEKMIFTHHNHVSHIISHERFVQKEEAYTIQMIDDLSPFNDQYNTVTSNGVGMLYAIKYALHTLKTEFNITMGTQI